MGWKTLTLDFDRSKPVTKFRFDVGTPLHYTESNNYFFSELPNIEANGKNWDQPSGATWGYAKENRGALHSRKFSNRQGGFSDRYWSATTLVETDIYEYDLTTPLYWAGMTEYKNQLAVADLALVKVWVDNMIELDVESLTIPASGGSSNVVVTSESGWTATKPAWITLSTSTGGTGNTTVSVSTSINNYYKSRTGEVVFTDGVDSVTLTVKQEGEVLLKNLYQGENSVKMMIRNGEKIYQQFTKIVFDVDKDSIEFPASGGTDTLTITANENWTMTVPAWLTASAVSGRSSATITLTSQPIQETLEGDIVITCNGVQKTVSVTAGVHDYSKDYFTIEATSSGNISYELNQNGASGKYVEHSINNGSTWVRTDGTGSKTIPVQSGDRIIFRGDISTGNSIALNYSASTATFEVYGNAMSMIYGDNFVGNNEFPSTAKLAFHELFKGCTGLTDASKLILSASVLLTFSLWGTYSAMFSGCTSLEAAPELPATTLEWGCYRAMFRYCNKLNYIKCLGETGISNACADWVQGVAATGTFVKKAGVTWPTGYDGIPSGWTVIEE